MSRPSERSGYRRRLTLLLAILGFLVAVQGALLLVQRYRSQSSYLTPERASELGIAYLPSATQGIVSDYSRILIEEAGTVRTLFFLAENGQRTIESRMDVARPYQLLVPYSQAMFGSYLFLPRHERVLIVGLGGGSMVRFLEHYDPELEIDVVEIDPAVIDVARDFFGTHPSPTVQIFEADGFDFLRTTTTLYDVIYMDAFLKPAEDTDGSGTHLRLKTRAFLRGLQEKVHEDGLIVFNVNELDDLEVIRDVFAQAYVFELGAPGVVAVGTLSSRRLPIEALREAARALDSRFEASFSFIDMVERLRPEIRPGPAAAPVGEE